MSNFNPFSNDNEDSSFEQGLPVNQAAKNVTKAATSATAKQANQFGKQASDDLLKFIYGDSTTPSEDQSVNDNATPQANTHSPQGAQTGSHANSNATQPPNEQAQMDKIRHELFGNYAVKFKSAQNSAVNITTDLEQEIEKARKERERMEEDRKREQEEEEERRKEAKQQDQQQQVAMPAGKKTGMMMGKKQQQPMAVQLERTKTEGNRGTSG
jgi:hypothetical protein